MSGSGNRLAGWPIDLEVELPGKGKVPVEAKAQKRFALEGWVPEGGLFILKPDRKPSSVVLPLEAFLEMLHPKPDRG